MKELSIKEKAKAYDEAKARMSKAYNSNRCTIGFMNEIFPEFKDEDERIKEEIINYFECQSRDEPCRKSIHDKWIAWIEKQGQTFTKEDTDNANKVEPKDYNGIDPYFGKPVDKVEPKFEVGDVVCDKSCTTLDKDAQPNYEIVGIRNGMYFCDEGVIPIEHQDEFELVGKKVEPNDHSSIDPHVGIPIDKIGPKFKVCEWLTENHPNSYARFMQILEIINVQGKKRYRISRDLHNDEDIVECRFVEDNWHSFNIRDIKDGDILVASDGSVFIYAGSTDIYAKFYVALTKCGILNLEGGNWEDKKSVYPATKEQRERFFAAMHDAGYEWDAEKKELKKISQRMISAEAKEAMYGKPTAWSEEDEQITLSIEQVMNCASLLNIVPEKTDKIRTWLKSIKQRIRG